jgi:diguanylate cyclase (GGDEF)-like protein/PAS domain S-box-containing protein
LSGGADTGLQRARILVTDDNAAVRSLVRRFLQKRGAWVSEADHAEGALAQIESHAFDLLITDIEMPGQSGFWLKQEAVSRYPHLQVLLMTGVGKASSTLEEVERANDRLLLKPFTLEELEHAVSAALAPPQPAAPSPNGAGAAEPVVEAPVSSDFQGVLESFPGVVYIAPYDDLGTPTYISPQIEELVGFSAREWLCDPALPATRLHPDDREMLQEKRARFLASGRRFRCEYRLLTRDGRIIWVHDEARLGAAALGERKFVHGLLLDITERKLAEETLRNMALLDDLTGLYNRRGFVTLAAQQLLIARRTRNPLLLLMVDLDGMKRINDALGHQEGDRALRETADVLTETFRKSDVIGRIGGDEFAVLAIETEAAPNGLLAERLQQRVDARNAIRSTPPLLSLSIGTAQFDPTVPLTLEELMTRADQSMYARKTARERALR